MKKLILQLTAISALAPLVTTTIACTNEGEVQLEKITTTLKTYLSDFDLYDLIIRQQQTELKTILNNFLVNNNLDATYKFMFATGDDAKSNEFISFDELFKLSQIQKLNLVLFKDYDNFSNIFLFDKRKNFSELVSVLNLDNRFGFDRYELESVDIYSSVKLMFVKIINKMLTLLDDRNVKDYIATSLQVASSDLATYLQNELLFNVNYLSMPAEIAFTESNQAKFEIKVLENSSNWFLNTFYKLDEFNIEEQEANLFVYEKIIIDNDVTNQFEVIYKQGQNQPNNDGSIPDISLDISQQLANIQPVGGNYKLSDALEFVKSYVTDLINGWFLENNVEVLNKDYEIKILKALSGTDDFWNEGWNQEANVWQSNANLSAITKGKYLGLENVTILNVTIMSTNSEFISVINDGPKHKLCAFHLPLIWQ